MLTNSASAQDLSSAARQRRALLALLLLVPVPTIGVFFAMMFQPTAGTTVGQAVFLLSKLWILALPTYWLITGRTTGEGLRPRTHGFVTGALLGMAISGAIVGAYLLFARDMIDVQQMREAAAQTGLNQRHIYIGFALYTVFINAWLEEYVWRWFVYRQCEALMPSVMAVVASALMFTAHHVLALKVQTGWDVTLLASFGVFVGGCIWSWCYRRFRSIWPGYLSHLIVDVAVFSLGWLLIINVT